MSNILVIYSAKQHLPNSISCSNAKFAYACFPHCIVKVSQGDKFADDSTFCFDDDSGEFLIGAVLNRSNLLNKSGFNDMAELLRSFAAREDKQRYIELEGSFAGVSVLNGGTKVCAYTDCLSNYPLYYYSDSCWSIASNKIGLIVDQMRELGILVKPDPVGVYSLLVNAYMLGDHTLVDGLRRVPVGCHLQFGDNGVVVNRHWDIPDQSAESLSSEDLVAQIDSLFMEAVSLQASKNAEYDYTNYCALSAGLDSRMAAFALRRLGIEDVVLYTYSETGQDDQITPQRMAHALGYEWVFRSLDSGLDLSRIEEGVGLSDFRVYYPWAAQLNGMMRLLDTKRMGLVHTGVIGDVILGTFCHKSHQLTKSYEIGDGAYSLVLVDKLRSLAQEELVAEPFSVGMIRNRAFNGACLGYSTVFQEYTEALSPFMYRPFFEFCMKLPDSARFGHALYYQWVREKFPDAARFPHNGQAINIDSPFVTVRGSKMPIHMIPGKAAARIKSRLTKRNGMNPMQFWYDNNAKVKQAMDAYFKKRIDMVNDECLRNDLIQMYLNHTAIDKTLVLSLLGYYELLFGC